MYHNNFSEFSGIWLLVVSLYIIKYFMTQPTKSSLLQLLMSEDACVTQEKFLCGRILQEIISKLFPSCYHLGAK